MPNDTAVCCAKMAEPIDLLHRRPKEAQVQLYLPGCTNVPSWAHWCHLANMNELSICGGNAAWCQVTLTACYYYCYYIGLYQVVCLVCIWIQIFISLFNKIWIECMNAYNNNQLNSFIQDNPAIAASNVKTLVCWNVLLLLKLTGCINLVHWAVLKYLPSVLWHCWFGVRKSIRPVTNWVMRCWHCYLSGARCNWFAYGPADATATPSSLLRSNPNWFFIFLVPFYPGCPGTTT